MLIQIGLIHPTVYRMGSDGSISNFGIQLKNPTNSMTEAGCSAFSRLPKHSISSQCPLLLRAFSVPGRGRSCELHTPSVFSGTKRVLYIVAFRKKDSFETVFRSTCGQPSGTSRYRNLNIESKQLFLLNVLLQSTKFLRSRTEV